MARTKTIQRTARLLHRTLATYFTLPNTSPSNTVTSVTEVALSPKLDFAKVYLSFISDSTLSHNKQNLIQDYNQGLPQIKKWLGQQLRHKLKRLPDLEFFLDDSVAKVHYINSLLNQTPAQ